MSRDDILANFDSGGLSTLLKDGNSPLGVWLEFLTSGVLCIVRNEEVEGFGMEVSLGGVVVGLEVEGVGLEVEGLGVEVIGLGVVVLGLRMELEELSLGVETVGSGVSVLEAVVAVQVSDCKVDVGAHRDSTLVLLEQKSDCHCL